MSDAQIIEFLIRNKKYMVNNETILDALRTIGWSVIKGLKWIADACQTLYNYSFNLVDFTTWGELNNWISTFKPVFIALMAISILALGIILIFYHEKKPRLYINFCLAILVVTSSTTILSSLNSIVVTGKDAVLGKETKSANAIIATNLYDLSYIDNKYGLKNLSPSTITSYTYPALSDAEIYCINITDVMNYDSTVVTTSEAKKILSKKLIYTYGNQSYLDDIYNGFGWNDEEDNDWFNDFYYRYSCNYFPCIIELLCIVIVFVCISYKVVRIIFEIAISRFLAYLYSSELSNSQKIAKILISIRDSYIVLILTAVLIKFYLLAQSYINSNSSGISNNTVVKCLILLFIAFSVIDGPNLIEKLTGIDAGLSSGVGKMLAGYHAIKGASQLAKGAAKAPFQAVQNHRGKSLQKEQLSYFKNLNSNNSNNNSDNSSNNNSNLNNDHSTMNNQDNNKSNLNNGDINSQANANTTNSSNSNNSDNAHSNSSNLNNSDINDNNSGINNNSDINNNSASQDSSMDFDNKNNKDSSIEKYNDLNGLNTSNSNTIGANTYEKMNKDISSLEKNNLNGSSGINPNSSSKYQGNIGFRNKENSFNSSSSTTNNASKIDKSNFNTSNVNNSKNNTKAKSNTNNTKVEKAINFGNNKNKK